MTSHDAPATFQTKVNLVLVPVVVRDAAGKVIENLKKEDFQLFDKGKPQIITRFSIEKPGSLTAALTNIDPPGSAANPEAVAEKTGVPMPERFVAYLFDDVHLAFADLARARDAAIKQIASSLDPGDRAAIYSTSGQTEVDFTDDKIKLNDALLKLRPRPIARSAGGDCPDLTYYMADLIQNKNDTTALRVAAAETMLCAHLDPTMANVAQQMAQSAASRVLSAGETETRVALLVLKNVVRRVSVMPGQRNIIVVSPGFLVTTLRQDEIDVLDRAVRANIAINTLDARGLYTVDALGDISRPPSLSSPQRSAYELESASAQQDVLAEIADGTGGRFFHNNNDLAAGFVRLAAAPECIYLLGFSPQNLKLDGSYHSLKVTVKAQPKPTLQARHGYFAPKHIEDPVEAAKQEISEALFSREIMRDIPIEVHTQFFKSSSTDAKLAVLARVDIKNLRFRKTDGRNRDDLVVVSGIFDRNGNYVTGMQKTIEMRLLDDTLGKRLAGGITIKTSFDVKPGSYFVRLVVRDSEGKLMAAENGAVEIPY